MKRPKKPSVGLIIMMNRRGGSINRWFGLPIFVAIFTCGSFSSALLSAFSFLHCGRTTCGSPSRRSCCSSTAKAYPCSIAALHALLHLPHAPDHASGTFSIPASRKTISATFFYVLRVV